MSGTGSATRVGFVVIGAGAWGTALAAMLARRGDAVTLVTRSPEMAREINRLRSNDMALPGLRLPDTLVADHAVRDHLRPDAPALVLLAMPAQETRAAVAALAPCLTPAHTLVVTAKGLERGTHALMADLVAQEAPGIPVAILSGPSFAHDVGAGKPTAVTLAADRIDTAEHIANLLKSDSFRPYASDDPVGVQLGGALKNVLAIAAGAVDGRGLGESAKAALITRGFAELSRLAAALGARPETLAGLSGLGDLILTCSTAGSRNYRFGLGIGQGVPVPKLLADGQPLAEGARTAAAALALGGAHGVDLPITAVVAGLVEGDRTVDDAIAALMTRPLRRE